MAALNRGLNALGFVCRRIFADFLMPCRLDLHRDLIRKAVVSGYEAHSILSFWRLLKRDGIEANQKYVILRHDVDNLDWITTLKFWEMERRMGLTSTFYFRLSTLMPSLMQEMHASGFEVGYHYEEIADVAKERGLARAEQISAAMPEIRERFKLNLNQVRERTGLPIVTASSHGDFANRKLGIPNWVLLEDEALRKETNIECEAYDLKLRSHINTFHSDSKYPGPWFPEHPHEAFHRGERAIHILTHPQHWHADRALNFVDEVARVWEGLQYSYRANRYARSPASERAVEILKDPSCAPIRVPRQI